MFKEAMNYNNINMNVSALFLVISFASITSYAQSKLSLEEATNLALQHNYDIQLAQKNIEVANNNSSIYNTGFLPTANLSGNGTITYNTGE